MNTYIVSVYVCTYVYVFLLIALSLFSSPPQRKGQSLGMCKGTADVSNTTTTVMIAMTTTLMTVMLVVIMRGRATTETRRTSARMDDGC